MKIAIISDIHEDIVSLRIAMAKIQREQCDMIVCLGDISGFSEPFFPYRQTRNAHECLAVVRANCSIIISGNHDQNAARITPENSPLFDYPAQWYEMDYHEKLAISGGKLWMYEENELNPLYTKSDIDFIATLPEYAVVTVDRQNILFSHYLHPNLTGAMKAMFREPNEIWPHMEFMTGKDCRLAFVGHEHGSKGCVYTGKRTKYFSNRALKIREEPACVLIPAIAGGQNRNGFCIFDVRQSLLKIKRI